MQLSQFVYQRGVPIQVSLTLRAGPRGAFVPKWFGSFNETCENGFSSVLLTSTGALAIKSLPGCGRSTLSNPSDIAEDFLKNFVHLAPGETRVWRTSLASMVDRPGVYTVAGEYLSFADTMSMVAELPEVQGLVASGRISAQRQKVRIK
jgi:hypothetical protein